MSEKRKSLWPRLLIGGTVAFVGLAAVENIAPNGVLGYLGDALRPAGSFTENEWHKIFPDHSITHRTIDQLFDGQHNGACIAESNVGLEGLTVTISRPRDADTNMYDATQAGAHHILHGYETGATDVPPIPLLAGRMILEGNFGTNCKLQVLTIGTGVAPTK